jgi:hypothetical protein
MANKRRRFRVGRLGSEAESSDVSTRLRLDHLRRSFTKFRRAHRPRTRIPRELREAALQALRCGAAELEVRRACRVTPEQLGWWRRRRSTGAAIAALDERAVRVFPVVDEEQEAAASVVNEQSAGRAAQQLQLRIGGWSISIRPVER